MGTKRLDSVVRASGKVDGTAEKIRKNTARSLKVCIKFLIFTFIHMVLLVVGVVILNMFVFPNIAQYNQVKLTDLLIKNIDGFRATPYAKYCYISIALWLYALLSELFLIFMSIKKFICIKSNNCLTCRQYLSCHYNDIKIERGY